MTTRHTLYDQADALIDSVDAEDMSPDLRSLVGAYQPRRDEEDPRALPFAKAIVRRAEREGLTAAPERSMDELRAEIASRNEGRDEADQVKPEGRKKADLEAALAADDARTE